MNLEATIGYQRWAEIATGKRTHLTISSGRWQKWCDLQKLKGAVPSFDAPGITNLDVLILKHQDPDFDVSVIWGGDTKTAATGCRSGPTS